MKYVVTYRLRGTTSYTVEANSSELAEALANELAEALANELWESGDNGDMVQVEIELKDVRSVK